MPFRFRISLTGRGLPKIQQPADVRTINDKTLAEFTRVVEQTAILKREAPKPKSGDEQ
jgi:hypothetical protein